MLLALLVVIVIGAGLYWYFVIKGTSSPSVAESPIETFTPRPTATPIQDPLALAFSAQGTDITLPASGDLATAFRSAINAEPNIAPGTLNTVSIFGASASGSHALSFGELLNTLKIQYPSQLTSSLRNNSRVVIYGQKEAFDSKGRLITNPPLSHRVVLVTEVDSSALPVLQAWEGSLAQNLAGIFSIDSAKNTGPFASTTYQNIDVRFKNFPYPDHSIDYAFVQLSDKLYLVISGSREAMYGAIDAMQGAVPGK
jgi:hypothetical protein